MKRLTDEQIYAIRRLTWATRHLLRDDKLPAVYRSELEAQRRAAGNALGIDLRLERIPGDDAFLATFRPRQYDDRVAALITRSLDGWMRVVRLSFGEIQRQLDARARETMPPWLAAAGPAAERFLDVATTLVDTAARGTAAIGRAVGTTVTEALRGAWPLLLVVAAVWLVGRRT